MIAIPAWGQPAPITVGAAVSQTGALAPLAADYLKALILWQDEVNALGGLLGRRVELRLLDDESDAKRSGELYAELIHGQADLLIGPYGSAATLMASAQAERARRVLINGAGPALAVHKRAPRYLFQTTMSNSAYGMGVLEVAKAAGISSAFIIARNDHTVQEMAESTHERAMKQGLDVGDVQAYGAGDTNFASYVYNGSADAWIVFGEARDTADVLRSLKKLTYAPRLFFARSAADPRFIRMVGQDAEYALAAKEYDPKFRTLGNEQFAAAFEARWSASPTFAAAQGYAAGTVLAEAVRRAKSIDQEKLRATLAEMETDTVLGGYKVDPETGEQKAARPALVQIQHGRAAVIWPEWLQSSTLQPYPQWSDRKLIE